MFHFFCAPGDAVVQRVASACMKLACMQLACMQQNCYFTACCDGSFGVPCMDILDLHDTSICTLD